MFTTKRFQRGFFLGAAVIALSILPVLLGAEVTSESPVQAVTDSSFGSYVLKSGKPVLVDFWATWCGPCRMYGPVIDKVAGDYKGRLRVARIDVDQNPTLSKRYGIEYIPTSLLIVNGKVEKRWVGVVSEKDLQKGIENALKKAGTK